MTQERLDKKLAELPNQPGCYQFISAQTEVLYIGKAKDLRKRVMQYFQKNHHDAKTGEMVGQITDLRIIITDTEAEALILEAELIRKHRPRYNLMLKDNRRYAYIEITDEAWPRLRTARKREGKGTFYGPYVDGAMRAHVIRTLTRSFQIRSCRRLPKKVCLYYHIGWCTGPCEGKVHPDDYADRIDQVRQHLEGRSDELIQRLECGMQEAAENMQYEVAKTKRDQMFAVMKLNERQKIDQDVRFNQDVIAYARSSDRMVITVFTIKRGTILAKDDFSFYSDTYLLEDTETVLSQFLQQYYSENGMPAEIIVEALDAGDAASLQENFSERAGHKVRVVVPQRGNKRHLVGMAKKNAQHAVLGRDQVLVELQSTLRLPELPGVIECFDISTLQGEHTVASMVQFRDGKPDKSNYRRFRIRTVRGQDDFAAMREVVLRRYRRLVQESRMLPNLVMIDGGKGQLQSALSALSEVGVHIPMISIAKREEEIYVPGRPSPLKISKKKESLKLLQRVRNEAHRFAINYHKLLRDKKRLDDL
ncbi:MAG: excinuclease ABC subunit UvrC [Nanoarchaeota archaeon]